MDLERLSTRVVQRRGHRALKGFRHQAVHRLRSVDAPAAKISGDGSCDPRSRGCGRSCLSRIRRERFLKRAGRAPSDVIGVADFGRSRRRGRGTWGAWWFDWTCHWVLREDSEREEKTARDEVFLLVGLLPPGKLYRTFWITAFAVSCRAFMTLETVWNCRCSMLICCCISKRSMA